MPGLAGVFGVGVLGWGGWLFVAYGRTDGVVLAVAASVALAGFALTHRADAEAVEPLVVPRAHLASVEGPDEHDRVRLTLVDGRVLDLEARREPAALARVLGEVVASGDTEASATR